jgi:phosphoribosylformylglycinamidine synthase II
MLWEIDVHAKDPADDHAARALVAGAAESGIDGCGHARSATGWLIEGDLTLQELERIAREVLIDPVTENFVIGEAGDPSLMAGPPDLPTVVHVMPRTGVTDPAAETARAACGLMGRSPTALRTLRKYWLPALGDDQAGRLARSLVASDAVHDVVVGPLKLTTLAGGRTWSFERVEVPLEGLDETALERLSRERCLALSVQELLAVRDHFADLGRHPSEIELETIAQTWSEHCCHKTLTSAVEHFGPEGTVHYHNLLKETVFAATQRVREALGPRDWCVSVFRDNSGVVRFDGDHDVCIKVETHNHPSALEPYGGAATGLGGVIRDVLGTGLGARPIAGLDVFCVAPLDLPADEVPPGVIHPRRILDGVVAGVRDYGNRMGIPTIAGAVAFHPGYVANPLVFCGTVGIMPRDTATAAAVRPGDLVVVAGGRTGRDGIHGATFSSIELSSASEHESGGSVQIGHAINEKMLADFVLEASRRELFHALTDCGAGGLSSAVGEMAAELGAEVHLDRVPLKYAGLSATEVWISEAQERMVLAVPPASWPALAAAAAEEGVEVTAIGTFAGDGRLRLCWQGRPSGELDCRFLHHGRPRSRLRSRHIPAAASPARWCERSVDVVALLPRLLALPDVASKERIVRQYDHEVQGGSVVKPLTGRGAGPADGTVIRGVLGRDRGLVLGVGLRHRLGRLDPWQMAAGGIVEAIANVVAAGADPARIALLDNFCWGDVRREDSLGTLVEACRACLEVATAFQAPFISGKDSLNNVFTWTDAEGGSRELSIPPTLLATALGQVTDVRRTCTPALTTVGGRLAVVGLTRDETAGSQLECAGAVVGGRVPKVEIAACRAAVHAVAAAIAAGGVRGCHDLSDGGLAVAAAEMAIGGGLGCRLDLTAVPAETDRLAPPAAGLVLAYSETPGRFLCEVPADSAQAFAAAMAEVPWAWVGEVTDELAVEITSGHGVGSVPLATLAAAWRGLSTEPAA